VLEVKDLNTFYGKSHILQGVTLNVRSGEIVCLLGRNGVGKSTTIKSIWGLSNRKKAQLSLTKRTYVTKIPITLPDWVSVTSLKIEESFPTLQ